MTEKRKQYLAKIAELYDPNNNIYKESLEKEAESFEKIKKIRTNESIKRVLAKKIELFYVKQAKVSEKSTDRMIS